MAKKRAALKESEPKLPPIKKQRIAKQGKPKSPPTKKQRVPYPPHSLNKAQYLAEFDIDNNGPLHEEKWAKTNINLFHKSMKLSIFQCQICHEAWPLKTVPRNAHNYICNRCSRDKNTVKKFSKGNLLIPSPVPHQLEGLTQTEQMLIARALPIMTVYIKPGGQRGYSGHCVNMPQNVKELARALPRYPKDVSVILVRMKGKNSTFKDILVRRQKVLHALQWLIAYNPCYKELTIDYHALSLLPENGIPEDIMALQTT